MTEEIQCAYRKCGKWFTPKPFRGGYRSQIFHTDKCRRQEWNLRVREKKNPSEKLIGERWGDYSGMDVKTVGGYGR